MVTTLKKGDIFYRISSEKDVDLANTYLPSDYRIKRDAKELERYVIMSETEAQKKKPRLEREVVTIPQDLQIFDDNVTLFIYAHKVAFIEFTTETSIIIENEFIASFLQKIFTLLFVSLKRNNR